VSAVWPEEETRVDKRKDGGTNIHEDEEAIKIGCSVSDISEPAQKFA